MTKLLSLSNLFYPVELPQDYLCSLVLLLSHWQQLEHSSGRDAGMNQLGVRMKTVTMTCYYYGQVKTSSLRPSLWWWLLNYSPSLLSHMIHPRAIWNWLWVVFIDLKFSWTWMRNQVPDETQCSDFTVDSWGICMWRGISLALRYFITTNLELHWTCGI